MRHSSEKRATMYVARVDIKTVFDVARPKPIADNVGDQEVHGWVTAALLREMARLDGHATFENQFPVYALHPSGERRSSLALALKMKTQLQLMVKELIEETKREDVEPKPAIL